MVTGVASAGSVMLHTICVPPATTTAPQYLPVSLDLSSTGVLSVMGSLGLAALETENEVAGSGGGVVVPGGAGGALLTVVSTPLTTASVPAVEVKDVVVLEGM